MLEQLFITFQILIIDVVMAADNAIIIGLIAANFAPDNRKKIIALGVAGAFIFRIFFATGANYIFEFPWVKILGGLLLIWVINNLRQDFFGQNKIRSPQLKSKETKKFSTGVYQVLIADLTLSFDNVLAVVAADMLGFSRLIEDDEINLLSRQKNQLNTIIKPEIENYNGEIIKTTGDGFLAVFPSALDAVQSSVSIQKGIYEKELEKTNDKKIRYRIGINVGDVVVDDGDIFGNTVNIASRLESIADAVNICITNDVYHSIKSLKSLIIENIGEQFLKNISLQNAVIIFFIIIFFILLLFTFLL